MRAPLATIALSAALGLAALQAAPAGAQTLNQLGIARLNADAQTLWAQDGLPMARTEAWNQLQKLVGTPHQVINSSTHATIVAVNSVTLDCPTAPGLTRLDGGGIEGRLPLSGTWRIAAEVRVHVQGRILGIGFADTFNVGIEVKNLWAQVRADLDSSDPAAPRITCVYPPQVGFSLSVTSTNDLLKFVSWMTAGTVNGLASGVARVGAVFLAQKLNLMVSTTPTVQNAGGPAIAPIAIADLQAAAEKLQQQAHDTKMPWGTIFEMRYRDPYYGTWEQSLADPNFRLDPVDFESIGDSTTNSGEWLAALCFRYACTRSPETKAQIGEMLGAYRILLTMKGTPGDLNRLIMPMSAVTQPLHADEYVVRFNGIDYKASDYISRDCYFGTLFGLTHVYDLVDDPRMKDEARQLIEMAIDYLLRNNWTWRKRDGSFGERWQGVLEQQYAWLLAAAHMNPAKYAAVRDQYAGFTDLLWSGFWLAVMDPYYSYYKFELGGGSIYTVLRLETDPVRWQRAYQGLAIQRHFIGHHQNALFNCFYAAADPSSRPALAVENARVLSWFLKGPRRKIVVDISQDPTIEHVSYALPLDPNLLYPSGNQQPTVIEIAKYPVRPEKRVSAGFMWSVSPCRLTPGYPIGPNPYAEGESTDLLLPYWMGRFYHAMAAPPPRPTGATATATATATSIR